MLKIITRENSFEPKKYTYKNTLVIGHDNWNDFGYCTNYRVYYCDQNGTVHEVGWLKIYNQKMDEESEDESENKWKKYSISSYLKNNTYIEELSENFCSLGQSLEFYRTLKKILPKSYKEILSRLRDIATNPAIKEQFKDCRGVRDSLLRETSAVKAFDEANEVINDIYAKHNMSFKYSFRPQYSNNKSELEFNFTKDNEYFPYRINAVIGKNGTGKTVMLGALANAISGNTDDYKEAFIGGRPSFYKVISMSYSIFDNFIKSKNSLAVKCSYEYCGIQTEDVGLQLVRPMSKAEIYRSCKLAYRNIEKKGRRDDWKKIITELLGEKELSNLEEQLKRESVDELQLSSGQNMIVLSISMAVERIENESILLIDEPETHLHPNALASLMRMLNMLLETYDSYAIIATHSPIILQEIPTNRVNVLERDNSLFTVRRPHDECFGAGISGIIDDVFEVRSSESCYKTYMREARKHMSEKEILEYFNNDLSVNALIYLQSISGDKK